MHLNCPLIMLADAAQPQMQQDPRAQTVQMVGMLVLMGVMFYFLLIRPQQKKAKEHANLLKGLKPGDKIVTSGGIVGIVITVKDKYVTIRSADTKLEVTKPAVAEVTERGGDNRES